MLQVEAGVDASFGLHADGEGDAGVAGFEAGWCWFGGEEGF